VLSMTSCKKHAQVIDLHTHLLPHTWADFSRRYGYQGFLSIDHEQQFVSEPGNARLLLDSEMYLEIGPACWDLNRRLVDMDRAGVDIQVRIQRPTVLGITHTFLTIRLCPLFPKCLCTGPRLMMVLI